MFTFLCYLSTDLFTLDKVLAIKSLHLSTMFTHTDKAYQQARSIKLGEYVLPDFYQRIVDWAKQKFQINLLDFTCETKQTSVGYKQQVVRLNLERTEECQRMDTPENQNFLAEIFKGIFLSPEWAAFKHDDLKKDFWSVSLAPFPEVIVGFYALEDLELKLAKKAVGERKEILAEKFPDLIWTIASMSDFNYPIIFFHTDASLKECLMNGVVETIKSDFLTELKKQDDFNYFGSHSVNLSFDSKESFERDYEGNWHDYFQ